MIIRMLMGLIIAPIASVGALYGLSMVVEPSYGAYGAPDSETVQTGEEPGAEPHQEPMGEPPLALPYEAGGAADFLARTFEGAQPYWLTGEDSRADLAGVSAQVAEPGSGGEAFCAPSHVQLQCTLRLADGSGYSFALQNMDGAGWTVVNDEVRLITVDLPYREGEAAAFLANALAGTQDPWIYGVDSRVDLASFSAQIAEPGSGGQASCTPAHDHIRCVLSRADGYGYEFPMEETASGDWVVRPDNVRLLDYS